jgi:hypothetical protein
LAQRVCRAGDRLGQAHGSITASSNIDINAGCGLDGVGQEREAVFLPNDGEIFGNRLVREMLQNLLRQKQIAAGQVFDDSQHFEAEIR